MNNSAFIKNSRKGFTLIELLVVMLIIVALASFSYYMFSNAKIKARDRKRKEDLKNIAAALILWKQDNPSGYMKSTGTGGPPYISTDGFLDNYLTLTPAYMQTLPTDPLSAEGSTSYHYVGTPISPDCNGGASNACTGFELVACLENNQDPDRDATSRGACIPNASYTVYSPN